MQRWKLTVTLVAPFRHALLLLSVMALAVCPLVAHGCSCITSKWELEQRGTLLNISSHTRASDSDAWKQDCYPQVYDQQPCSLLLGPNVVRSDLHVNKTMGLHRRHLRGERLSLNLASLECITVDGAVGGIDGNSSQKRIDDDRGHGTILPSSPVASASLIEMDLTAQITGAQTQYSSAVSSSILKDMNLDRSPLYPSLSDGSSRYAKPGRSLRLVQVDPGVRRTYHTDHPETGTGKSYRSSVATDRRNITVMVKGDGIREQQLAGTISQLIPTLNHRRHLMALGRRHALHSKHAWNEREIIMLHFVKQLSMLQLIWSIAVMSVLGMFLYMSRKRRPDGSYTFGITSCMKCLTKPSTKVSSFHPKTERPAHRVPYGPLRRFQFKELEQATNKFSSKIGSGGFGEVFKGSIENGKLIAVKRGIPAASDTNGMREMMKEIEILSALRHRHLVTLLGYCNVDTSSRNVLLVYEYVPNGTLADHLYGEICGMSVLSWAERLRIARDAARAIAYLHSGVRLSNFVMVASMQNLVANTLASWFPHVLTIGCNRLLLTTKISVIHRDIKPSNILLDENLRAKVGDFGISTVVPNNEKTHITTGVKGTVGYLDPLYHVSHQLTHKSDVYSFGIVLLELVSGRRAIDLSKAEQDWQVLPWLHTTYPAQGSEAVTDPRLERGTYSRKSVNKVIDCAILCCQPYSRNRPDMCGVLQMIDEAIRIQTTEGCGENFDTASSSTNPSLTSTPRRSTGSVPSPRGPLPTVDRPIHIPY